MADNVAGNGGDESFRCVPASAFTSWGCLELDTDARLCADGLTFNASVYLAHSNVSLDCGEQTLSPRGGRIGNSARSGIRTPYSYSISNVAITNCQIVDAPGYGIDLKRLFRDDEPCLNAPNKNEINADHTANCRHALLGHQNIRVANVGIYSPSQIGIYVGQSSRNIEISDVDIDAAYIGIYLEASSERSIISRAVITNSTDREGIAVDSSRYNIIQASVFQNNGPNTDAFPDTAINVYKNAGEYDGQVCPVIRPWGADHNIIRGNHFYDDDVNVASREDENKYLQFWDYYYYGLHYRDRANNNVIVDNVFYHGAQLDMLDDTYIVHGNQFRSGAELELGGKHHEYTLHGTVAQNVFEAGARIRLNSSVWGDLDIRNNFATSGQCSNELVGGKNKCGGDYTVVWGEDLVNAGLIAVLF